MAEVKADAVAPSLGMKMADLNQSRNKQART